MAAASRRASRAAQLDALRLDNELHTVLLNCAKSALRFHAPAVRAALEPEMSLLLRALIFCNTVAVDEPTPGLALSNLRLCRSGPEPAQFGTEGAALTRGQKAALFALSALAPYALTRLERAGGGGEWPRAERALRLLRGCARLLEVFNALLFLRGARFRAPAERAAGATLVYVDLNATRRPPMELLHRTLVWQGIAQLALFVAPLVAAVRAPAFLRRAFAPADAGPDERGPGQGECPECGAADMVMPHTALPCRCVFCYACVAVPLEKDVEYKCSRCNMAVHSLRRVSR